MAPSSYYAAKTPAPSARARRDEELIPQLIALWESNCCVYGVRKLWKAARRTGIMISRDQVARLMRAAGIEGASRSKRVKTTRPDPTSARHPDLVRREFTATRAVNSRRFATANDSRRSAPHRRSGPSVTAVTTPSPRP